MRARVCLAVFTAAALLGTTAVAAEAQAPPGNGPDSPAGATINEPDAIGFRPDLLGRLKVPAGFQVGVFAKDAGNVRIIHVRPNGDVYVSRRRQGDLLLLQDRNRDGAAEVQRIVAQNIPLLHGITSRGNTLYLTANRDIWTAAIRPDSALGPLKPIVTDLPDAGQHSARTLEFGPDGYLYVGIGSTCNTCEEANPENATMVRMKPDGTSRTVFARGLRHTIGFGWHPTTKGLWGFDQGSDWHGDEQPPEELNALVRNGNYGWPWCFGSRQPDPFVPGQPPNETKTTYCTRTAAPALTYTAHSAAIAMRFYDGQQFPADYRGDAFVAMRGSWNRAQPTGYKVLRVRFDASGAPTGTEDFLSGFLIDPRVEAPANPAKPDRPAQFGRVAGVGVWTDGSLLVSDDQNGVIYRVTYGKRAAATKKAPAVKPLAAGARAVLFNEAGKRVGSSVITTAPSGALTITTSAVGLTPGAHGTHVHENGTCAPGPDPVDGTVVPFGAAGAHFDPGSTRNHGRPEEPAALTHAGDLPAIIAGADGTGQSISSTNDMSLDDGAHSIIGRSILVHANADDYASEPAGMTGTRVACGVIIAAPTSISSRHQIPGGNVHPEGIAYDARRDLAYIGSAATGDIYRLDPKTSAAIPFAIGGAAGRTSALGLELDRYGRLLIAGGNTGKVAILRASDAAPLATLDTTRTPQSLINDLAVTPSNDVFVTDSYRPVIFTFNSGRDRVGPIRPWLDLTKTPIGYRSGVNLNGIVATRDGRYLLAVQSNTGQLWRISTATKAVREVSTGTVLSGGDGLHLDGQTLYVVRNGARTIVRLQLAADYGSGRVTGQVTDPNLMFPTTMTRRGSRFLVVNAQLDRRGKGLPPVLPFVITGVEAAAFNRG